jgi:uncharacterized protein
VKVGKIEFEAFEWDDGNYLHCQTHGIQVETIEKIFEQQLLYFEDMRNSSSEKRWIAVGESGPRRLVFVAYTIRKIGRDRLLRPISARYIHRNSREEKVYEEIRKKLLARS